MTYARAEFAILGTINFLTGIHLEERNVFSTITKALKKMDTVTLVGFGTFKAGKRKARKGMHPQTGEEIKIKAKTIAKFVPGKALKDALS